MFLQLKPLFIGELDSLPVDCTLDYSELEFQNNRPFPQPVRVHGKVQVSADIVTLRAVADMVYHSRCDRCLAEIERPMTVPIEHVLVTSLTQEDDAELVLVDNFQLPLDDLVREDLIFHLPSKNLCRQDCRGLCPTCGKDLNQGLCGCRADTIDPRLAILKQWADQSESND